MTTLAKNNRAAKAALTVKKPITSPERDPDGTRPAEIHAKLAAFDANEGASAMFDPLYKKFGKLVNLQLNGLLCD